MIKIHHLFLLALLAGTFSLAVPPELLTIKSTTMVQIKSVTQWVGATLGYDAKTAVISITYGKHTARLTINSTSAMVDGKRITLNAAPCQKEYASFAPLGFIVDYFGLKMTRDNKKQTATLTNPATKKTLTLSAVVKKPLDIMQFFQAIATGDEASFNKQLVATPELFTAKGPEGETPAFVAAATGQLAILKLLEGKGADIKATLPVVKGQESVTSGATLLHGAVMSGKEDMVEYLVGKGLDVNAATAMGFTPLIMAVGGADKTMVEFLVAHGADLKITLPVVKGQETIMSGAALLHYAVMSGKEDMVEYLVGKGLDVNAATSMGLTPLLMAVRGADKTMVEFLLAHGADVKAKLSLTPEALSDPKTKEMSEKEGFGTVLMFAFGRTEVEDVLKKHNAPALSADLVKELTQEQEKAKQSECMSKLRQIAMTAIMYAQEHDGKLPDAAAFWKTLSLDPQLTKCPVKPDQANGYGFNKALGAIAVEKVGDPDKVIFAADAKTDIISSPDDIDRTRHGDCFCAVFCDGHVEALKSDAEVKLIPAESKTSSVPTEPPQVTQHAVIQTAKGDIEVELYGKDAPNTVDNFVKLANKHFYKNLTFHRVESAPNFRLIQGGDPKGDSSGGPGYSIKLEISPKLRHVKGALAMARSDNPDSAGSQFYICLVDIPQLNDKYAVFGKVTKGLDVADKIVKGDKIIDVIIK